MKIEEREKKRSKNTILDKCQFGCLINKRWFGIVSTLSEQKESFESEKGKEPKRGEKSTAAGEPFTFAYTTKAAEEQLAGE